jgi:hypothetical protein
MSAFLMAVGLVLGGWLLVAGLLLVVARWAVWLCMVAFRRRGLRLLSNPPESCQDVAKKLDKLWIRRLELVSRDGWRLDRSHGALMIEDLLDEIASEANGAIGCHWCQKAIRGAANPANPLLLGVTIEMAGAYAAKWMLRPFGLGGLAALPEHQSKR